MSDYRYLLVDASTGLAIGELPMTVTSFTYQLNAAGQLSGTIPRDHRLAQDIYWALFLSTNSDREITVLRDEVPVWNGPVTLLSASLRDPSQMQVTAREASWYLSKRTIETDLSYIGQDLYTVVRDLVGSYMVGKTSTAGDGMGTPGQNINAALPRWSVAPAVGTSGVTLTSTASPTFYGTARHLVSQAVDDELVADPTTQFDYRMDYTTGSTRGQCHRTFTVGVPLGTLRAQKLDEYNLYDFNKTEDRERAANRAHVLSGAGPVTLQNTGSTANGDILIESTFDYSGVNDLPSAQAYARDARRRAQPPVVSYGGTYVPGVTLPFNWCLVGDQVQLAIQGSTILHSLEAHVRVIQIEVIPPQGGNPELVSLGVAVPLDALGA